MPKRLSKILLLYQWHRWVGLFAALSALVFSITGIALNHTDELTLDSRYVGSAWLRQWYHFAPSRLEAAFSAGDNWLYYVDGQLYWNDESVDWADEEPLGLVQAGSDNVVAFPDKLVFLGNDGNIVDVLDEAAGVPGGIVRIGQTSDMRIIVENSRGEWVADTEWLTWEPASAQPVVWDKPDEPDITQVRRVQQDSNRRKLTLERLLLDLHSGRFFGKAGVWLADLSALALMFLGLSGVSIWLIRLIKKRQHQKRKRARM